MLDGTIGILYGECWHQSKSDYPPIDFSPIHACTISSGTMAAKAVLFLTVIPSSRSHGLAWHVAQLARFALSTAAATRRPDEPVE